MIPRGALITLVAWLPLGAASAAAEVTGLSSNFVAGEIVELNDNGAWSWFMDERAIVDRGKLIVGSVRAVGDYRSGQDDPSWGNVEIAVLDLATQHVDRTVLHEHLET